MHLLQRGPRHVASIGAQHALADGLIIAVEHEGHVIIEQLIAGCSLQDELLEEPRGVAKVPLRRRDIYYWLHHMVLHAQWGADGNGAVAHSMKACCRVGSVHRGFFHDTFRRTFGFGCDFHEQMTRLHLGMFVTDLSEGRGNKHDLTRPTSESER